MKAIFAALLLASAAPALAQTAPEPAPAPRTPPKLIVVVSVDQLSGDLFQQYREHFSGGFARLLQGAVFPSAYQAHAASETCPGHSTILTGAHPARNGIIANTWVDQDAPREDKLVYCAEDERAPGTDHSKNYVSSVVHLKVPTLGDLMKAATPRSRVVAVAGKDRAALMMGGRRTDEVWFWKNDRFETVQGRPTPPVVQRAQAAVAGLIARPQAALPLPDFCRPLDRAVRIGEQTLGRGRFERAAGDARAFRGSPASDAATLSLAAGFAQELAMGRGPGTDLLIVGASATDYVGHAYGTQGTEMCLQIAELDRALGSFFDVLDRTGVDYQVVLTADHGAHDATERLHVRAVPAASRIVPELSTKAMAAAIARDLKLSGPVLLAAEGDVYVDRGLPPATRARVLAEAKRRYSAHPQVAAAYTRAEIAATPIPTSPPETWSLIERARASFDPERSGDMLVMFRPRVTPIDKPGPGYVETHGSPWDYDRRVPLLFWRRGQPAFEQALSVQTVDILPTLAAPLRLDVGTIDGRCLDLDPGEADTCR